MEEGEFEGVNLNSAIDMDGVRQLLRSRKRNERGAIMLQRVETDNERK